jgi:type II secretory pathway component PulF
MSAAADRDQFLENMGMLVDSGVDVLSAIDAASASAPSEQMRKVVLGIKDNIAGGATFWQALKESKLFSPATISLIKVGEESGKLSQNLKLVLTQNEKSRSFHSRILSATLYPVIVIFFMLIIGIGVAWFVLPHLAASFAQLNVALPGITRVLIGIGNFLGRYGLIAVPSFLIVIALIAYFFFFSPKTKFIGDAVLLHTPIIKSLIRDTEISRFGYVVGILLEAGIPLVDALRSLAETASLRPYRKLYRYLSEGIAAGDSFKKSFASYPAAASLLTPAVIQIIIFAEQTGRLPDAFLRFSATYEEKTELTAKNFPIIVEPILLVFVGIIVFLFAIAIILPIYSLTASISK